MDFEPPIVGCVISNRDYTFSILKQTKECVINIPTVELAAKVVGCGNTSGRDVDKSKVLQLTPAPASLVKAPLIDECYANLECKVVDARMVTKYNFFILQVQKAWITPSTRQPRTIPTNVQYARFADDLVILVDAERRSDWLVKAIDRRLREEFAKLRVEINEDKSRMVDLKKGESFTFLGFEYRRVLSLQRKWRPYYAPKLKKRIALFERLREIFRKHVSWPVETVITKINPVLRGWVNYFRVGHSSICFGVVKRWVEEKVRRHLMRARGRKGFGWTRWSSEWLYDRLGLFNNYQRRRWSGAKVAPAR
jgi:flavin reductase (DIM6/NTAB) family NADH-FMN oxidoreductase RutF